MTATSHDIVISGGGLVGASLALALSQLQLDVALVEAIPVGSAAGEQPSFDERTTAISNGTQRIFDAIGVWPLIERAATPIKRIHVSDQGRFGFARINAQEQGLSQLGYVVINRIMGDALWRRLREAQVTIYAPARVASANFEADRQRIILDNGTALDAKLVIAADGAKSALREAAGIGSTTQDYGQTAVVTNLATQKFHENVAYERFTPTGPIAMLPLSDARVGVIWMLPPAQAEQVLQLPDAEFMAQLQTEFGLRLGRFTQVGKRFGYPLSLTQADRHIASRLAVVGNAAQGLHPIAGQGFNLGLRDAACLAEVIADAQREQAAAFDPGSAAALDRYQSWRSEDRQGIVRFTDGLVRLFAQSFGPFKTLRNVGMLLLDLAPPAKDYLARLSLGAAGKIPRLARGGTLRE